jgi:hypothetical protein
MDVCGSLEKRSKGGSRFFATFTDDYSKLSVVIPIEKKSQVVAVVRNTVSECAQYSAARPAMLIAYAQHLCSIQHHMS